MSVIIINLLRKKHLKIKNNKLCINSKNIYFNEIKNIKKVNYISNYINNLILSLCLIFSIFISLLIFEPIISYIKSGVIGFCIGLVIINIINIGTYIEIQTVNNTYLINVKNEIDKNDLETIIRK